MSIRRWVILIFIVPALQGCSDNDAATPDSGVDAAVADAFAHPGGLCYGGSTNENPARELMFFVNLGDGTAWRISLASSVGDDPLLELVGGGLATGTPGNPGQPGAADAPGPDGSPEGDVVEDAEIIDEDDQDRDKR